MSVISLSKPNISKKEISLISKSLKSGWLTHGPNNLIFEKNFSKYIKTKYAISMNSCTSALECALKALDKKGEIIIPSWTWVSTANAVLNTGNTPVFADVDLNSRNLTADLIKKKNYKKNNRCDCCPLCGFTMPNETNTYFNKKKKIIPNRG